VGMVGDDDSEAEERWRHAGWLGARLAAGLAGRCLVSWRFGGAAPPGQPARRQRSVWPYS